MAQDLAEPDLDPQKFGFKAHYLGLLNQAGFAVPPGIVLGEHEQLATADVVAGVAYAVRSSGIEEDSFAHSFAGSFVSEIGPVGFDEIGAAVQRVRAAAGARAGVIVQRLVDAEFAGVAFSVDPTSYGTDTQMISWVPGLGGPLVAGEVTGTSVVYSRTRREILGGKWCVAEERLHELSGGMDELATLLAGPVDIEWCIERGTGRLYFLQVRPIVLPRAGLYDVSRLGNLLALPAVVSGHPKLQLRREALDAGVMMTPAVVLVGTAREIPAPQAVERSAAAAGSSVVLLHPFTVDNQVVREFSNVDDSDISVFTATCRRYSVRQYPSFDGIVTTQRRVLDIGLNQAALSIVLEQEIWNAWTTGIVRRLESGYIIEVALGHFVPKGYVDTSTYFVNDDLNVIDRREVLQKAAYHFVNGHVIREDHPEDLPALDARQVAQVIGALRPLLARHPSLAYEFGITAKGAAGQVYLIDAAESDAANSPLSAAAFRDGVVSHGTAEGIVMDLRHDRRQDLNAHLYGRTPAAAPEEPTVFIASRASVDLLGLLYACAPGSGFVFEEASLLAHFAVVLRELGVAGIVLPASEVDLLARSGTARINTRSTPMVSMTVGRGS